MQRDDGYPEARRCHSAVQIKETVWIFGGNDGEEVYGDVWQLNLDTRQWTRSTIDLPIPVYFHAMTVTGEGMTETVFTLQDLKTKFPKVDVTTVIQCNGNRREDFHYLGLIDTCFCK